MLKLFTYFIFTFKAAAMKSFLSFCSSTSESLVPDAESPSTSDSMSLLLDSSGIGSVVGSEGDNLAASS